MRNKKHSIAKLKQPSPLRTPTGFLATLFRKILMDRDYTDRIMDMVTRTKYLQRSSGEILSIAKNRDDVFSDQISIKVFFSLLKNVLRVKKIRLSITIWDDTFDLKSKGSTHSIDVDFIEHIEEDTDAK